MSTQDNHSRSLNVDSIIGRDVLSELARTVNSLDISGPAKLSIEDLNFLRQVSDSEAGDLPQLDALINRLELTALHSCPSFMLEPSFVVDGFGKIEDVAKVESTKREAMAREHNRRMQIVLDVCKNGIAAGKFQLQDGGIKSSHSIERRINQGQHGDRIDTVPDVSRLRIIFADLVCLEKFFDQLINKLAVHGFGYVGCRNKYFLDRNISLRSKNGELTKMSDYPGNRWRCINTVWSCDGEDRDVAQIPTEIQLVTSAMQRVAKIRHPFRTFSPNADLKDLTGKEESQKLLDGIETLTAKIAIYDLKGFLDNR